jgi:hypothetical protein
MAKNTKPQTNPVHDFTVEPIFQGKLISEGPEYFTFEDEDEQQVDIEKEPSLVAALRTKFNETEVRKSDLFIGIEYLGVGTKKDGSEYSKFAVSVDA